MKILVSRALTPKVETRLAAEFDVTFRDQVAPMTVTESRAALAQYDAVLVTLGDQFPAQAFDGAPRARLIANFGVGFNHIDVNAARAQGIAVTNTPGAVTDATADLALALILASARRVVQADRYVRSGQWTGWQPTQFLGTHVSGKTVGIIGYGRIGRAIAQRCHFGFGMPVLFANRSLIADPGLPAQQCDLPDLLARSDFVVVAVPASPATHHLIDAAALAQMQSRAHLINIARGDIVDETALIAALRAGHIAGAGLDVYEHEPTVPDALKRLETVTLLPHLGTAAEEVRDAMGFMVIDNLIAFRDGQPLPNPV